MASPKALPKALPLLCFLGFFFLFLSSPAAEAAEAHFLHLTLIWPGTLCGSSLCNCCLPTTGMPACDFFVDAIKSYDSATGQPLTNCFNSSCRFFVNALRPFIDDMFAYWPDVRCPSNNGVELWRSTWCTYGTCSNLTQADYFKRALDLRRNINLLNVLASHDIVPSKTKFYGLEDIESALAFNYSSSAVVECSRKSGSFVYDRLDKVRFCVSADAMRLIPCPDSGSSNCAAEVKFLPFTIDMLGHGLGSKSMASSAQMDQVM